MMRKGVFVTGTDTGVGKTVVAAGLAGALREKGINVGVMKPVETGALMKKGELIAPDAQFLVKASRVKDPHHLLNPYSFEAPLAPSLASQIAGIEIDIKKIVTSYRKLIDVHQFTIVEGVGGLLVPLKEDYLATDLIRELNLPLIVVARPGLGTINHTVLTVKCARMFGIEVVGVIINYSSEVERGICEETNPQIISRIGQVPILGIIPYLDKVSVDSAKLGNLIQTVSECIDLDKVVGGKERDSRESSKKFQSLDKLYLWHPFTQMKDYLREEPLVIEEGKGSYLKDTEGRWYLDGISSLWVNVHGHRRKEIDEAIYGQLGKVAHSTLLGLANIPSVSLAKKLVEITPQGLNKVFYSDSGSTAVEIALKISFQYWQQKSKETKMKFISFKNAYHGDTIGSVSVGGIDLFHKTYEPLLFQTFQVSASYCYRCHLHKTYPGCQLACVGELEALMEKHHREIAALIMEPLVQAAAGMLVWPPGFLSRVRSFCTKYNILMIADEVATGFGRTGRMFACEHEGVSPDIMLLAKSITGGHLPLAATLTTNEIYEAFLGEYGQKKTFFHGHTYTGNPLACAAALANLEIFENEKTLEKLPAKIKFLQDELEKFKTLSHVGQVRQRGMMVGIELVHERTTKREYAWEEKIGIRATQEARRRGLILRPLGNVIVLMPPLSISLDELKELTAVTRDSIQVVTE